LFKNWEKKEKAGYSGVYLQYQHSEGSGRRIENLSQKNFQFLKYQVILRSDPIKQQLTEAKESSLSQTKQSSWASLLDFLLGFVGNGICKKPHFSTPGPFALSVLAEGLAPSG
jgi:hypothetical protein